MGQKDGLWYTARRQVRWQLLRLSSWLEPGGLLPERREETVLLLRTNLSRLGRRGRD
jgi:hypothetical protein